MQLPGRVPLLLALFLLTSAATAYAECAWVLWEEVFAVNKDLVASREWGTISATTTQQECVSFISEAVTRKAKALGEARGEDREVQTEGPRVRFISPGTRTLSDYTYRCLPDTVDPRGPKGK